VWAFRFGIFAQEPVFVDLLSVFNTPEKGVEMTKDGIYQSLKAGFKASAARPHRRNATTLATAQFILKGPERFQTWNDFKFGDVEKAIQAVLPKWYSQHFMSFELTPGGEAFPYVWKTTPKSPFFMHLTLYPPVTGPGYLKVEATNYRLRSEFKLINLSPAGYKAMAQKIIKELNILGNGPDIMDKEPA
jgi:hypothetical protein